MTNGTNPLMIVDHDKPKKRGKVTLFDLEEMAASLNRSRFVIESGCPYFVNRQPENEGGLHFLDRRTMRTW